MKPAYIRRGLAALAQAILLSACGLFALPQESGALLLRDSFASQRSGWQRVHGQAILADYSNYRGGAFLISLAQPRGEAWTLAGLELADVDLAVRAEMLSGPEDNAFGLICRYQDPANYIFFLISSDGYAGIGQVQGGQRRLLSGSTLLPSPAIRQGAAQNDLRALCDGNILKLYVNRVQVLEARTQLRAPGDVGLLALSYDEPGVVIAFDDFELRNP
jgi:hypothetical protein